MKKFLALAALVTLFAAATASAASYEGKWGFSLNSSSTPVGVTFGLGKSAALDVGVGFTKTTDYDLGWAASVGIRSAMVSTDNANLFVRGFAGYATTGGPSAATTSVKDKTLTAGIQLGGEWWPTSAISVFIRHGIELESSKHDTGSSTDKSVTTISTMGETLGQAGFTLWWGGK